MIDAIQTIINYISGLYTLPWILIGFILTILIAKITGREKIDKIMKKIGLIILYFFVPVLIFRIFLNTPLGENELIFAVLTSAIIAVMYIIALIYGKYIIKKQKIPNKKSNLFLKTIITNQGRSSAFIADCR